jgi:hypothetical protein
MSLGAGLEGRVLWSGADVEKRMARLLPVEASEQPVEDHQSYTEILKHVVRADDLCGPTCGIRRPPGAMWVDPSMAIPPDSCNAWIPPWEALQTLSSYSWVHPTSPAEGSR